MLNELLHRADRAIAESKRLIEELSHAMLEAERLDRWLHELHQRRIDEERPAMSAFAPLSGPRSRGNNKNNQARHLLDFTSRASDSRVSVEISV